ncbi:DUF3017 domain-containing protein [Nocardioides ferulae]|uniref:DUF3017 domain-containing protein n=1 Tax=Nocardioides ferulae TaxID=2340821 RepID=UPI001F0C7C41|nr:DUF3017 domain-containing protein [Nocardioides ferulae]
MSEHDPQQDPDRPPVPSPEEVAAELAGAPAGEERRYPSTIGGAVYIAVLVVTAVGIGIVVTGDWRVGIRWVAGAVLGASLLRLLLPAKDAGMLAVRHRLFDSLLYAGIGAALIALTVSIPDQPLL